MSERQKFVEHERSALSDIFVDRGAYQATLCEGWLTRDLLEHLVRRDAGPLRTMLAGRAAAEIKVTGATWEDLVHQFRTGPPFGSPFKIPGAEAAGNFEEFFIHHEDVRRATAGWSRRQLPVAVEDAIWRRLRSPLGKLAVRRSAVGIHIQRDNSNGAHVMLRATRPPVVVIGPPSELLMFLFGRQQAADVDIHGPAHACEELRDAKLGF